MNHKVVRCLIAGALSTILAFASPALAQRGGGGGGFGSGAGGGGHAGGMGGGGMGGGGHAGGFGGGMGGGMRGGGGGAHFSGGGAHFGGMSGGANFGGRSFVGGRSFAAVGGGSFAGSRFAHTGFAPRFSRFHDGRFFHHRHNRFAFIGAPYIYAGYDNCWRRVWTPYGLRWANVCGGYGYY
jgi:hypothetical protein